MYSYIEGIKITSICSIVPTQVHKFEDEIKYFPFPENTSRRLGKVMGFREHRIAPPEITFCDLAADALSFLLEKNIIAKDEIDELIFVSQHREYPMPGNSKVLHGMLALNRDTHCVDMYENCTGFISGLHQAACNIKTSHLRKVVLVNAETGACYANIKDRNTYPLSGDAGAVTIVEPSDDPSDRLCFEFKHDTELREVLMVPAGGMRMPATEETSKMVQDESGNFRSLNQQHMDGTAVFHYVMDNVPPVVGHLLEENGLSKEDIDFFLTHQPNRFMLLKLAETLEVPNEKLFNNIVENFGNPSGVTIPLNISFNLRERLVSERFRVCLAAFGAGMSVAAALMNLGKLKSCDLIEYHNWH